MTSVIKAENNKDLYMVFDYMETDVHNVCIIDWELGYKRKNSATYSLKIYSLLSVERIEISTFWWSNT